MFEQPHDPIDYAGHPEGGEGANEFATGDVGYDGFVDLGIYPPDEPSYGDPGGETDAPAEIPTPLMHGVSTEMQEGEGKIETLGTRLEAAIDEIKSESLPKEAYSLEMADQERPFTHYTEAGNIFQVLRFGIQSGNFKSRINALRQNDEAVDEVAPQMSGLRFQKGGSYQGVDSISLGTYDERTVQSRNLVFLVGPETKVFGLHPEERDSTTGYGHGIVSNEADGDFDIGNPTAYKDEVLAANIIPPSEIKAVAVNERTSIMYSLQKITGNNAVLYSQAKLKNPEAAKEDLLANSRLFAALTGNPEATAKVDALAGQVETMQTNDLTRTLSGLQRDLLQELVGQDVALSEPTLRETIERRFGITIISTPK